MRGLRILYVCSDEGIDLFGTRGCCTHVREMCKAFQALGCEVRLVVSNDGGAFDPSFDIKYDSFCALESKKLGYDFRKLLLNRQLGKKLAETRLGFEPDIIYERYDLYATAGSKLALRSRIPHVIEVNAPLVIEQRNVLHFPRLARLYERRTLSKASLLVGVSPDVCDMMRETAPDAQILLVENGVNIDLFNPSVSGEAIKRRYGLDGKTTIGFVGSLKGRQGISTMIRAAMLLLEKNDSLRFLIVGGGNNLAKYRKQVTDSGHSEGIILTGPAPNHEVPSYIAAFDVCVAPYMPYPELHFSSIKLKEYVAMQKPIVTTDLPQIREVLRDGLDAILAKPADEKGLAEKIASLIANPASMKMLAQSAHDHLKDGISWTDGARKILDAVRNLPENGNNDRRLSN
ncbi:glycosyltransferase family 4 protein [bacterium]|nr:glycosyltransferase family 4 protein [bacterium]